ncbi:hypothetical protein LCGC14_2352140 [marine sediment metagenome]|uniref:Uncharacterized protein n=1 Tax=marine sediment metagenome TaxID=412755 RepID=A0A0F9C9I6_9ZZZZ
MAKRVPRVPSLVVADALWAARHGEEVRELLDAVAASTDVEGRLSDLEARVNALEEDDDA